MIFCSFRDNILIVSCVIENHDWQVGHFHVVVFAALFCYLLSLYLLVIFCLLLWLLFPQEMMMMMNKKAWRSQFFAWHTKCMTMNRITQWLEIRQKDLLFQEASSFFVINFRVTSSSLSIIFLKHVCISGGTCTDNLSVCLSSCHVSSIMSGEERLQQQFLCTKKSMLWGNTR